MDNYFKCDKCSKKFKYKYLLNRHYNNKKPCNINIDGINQNYNILIKNIDDNIILLEELSLKTGYICKFCNKEKSNKSNLTRHIKESCNNKKILLDEKNKIIQDRDNKILEFLKDKQFEELENLESQKIELEKVNKLNEIKILELNKNIKLTKLKQELNNSKNIIDDDKNITNNITNNNITNNTNNKTLNITINNNINDNNNNIKINPFGKEDLSHITEDDYKRFISKCKDGLLAYIDKIYFSEDNKTNRNMYLSSLGSKYMYVYKKNNWNAVLKKDTIDNLLSNKNKDLNNKCNEFAESGELNEDYIDCYKHFRREIVENNNNELEKQLRDSIGLLLFNNKDKVIIDNNQKSII